MTVRFVPGKGTGSSVLGGFPRGIDGPGPTTTLTEDGATGGETRELPFVAQFDLAAVRGMKHIDWLSPKGILYLFWDHRSAPGGYRPEHAEGWAVRFLPEPPDEPIEQWPQLWPQLGEAAQEAASIGEPERKVIGADPDPEGWPNHLVAPPLTAKATDAVRIARLASSGIVADGDEDLEAPEVVAALGPDHDWAPLLQIEGDISLGWDGFDSLYVLVRTSQAAESDFSSAWMVASYEE